MTIYHNTTRVNGWNRSEASRKRVKVEKSSTQFAVYQSVDGDIPEMVSEHSRRIDAEMAAFMLSRVSLAESLALYECGGEKRVITHFIMSPQGVSWLDGEEERITKAFIDRFGGE